jgi:parallel beta-helix repeat protein
MGYPNSPGGSHNIISGNLLDKCSIAGIKLSDGIDNEFYGNIFQNIAGSPDYCYALAFGMDSYNLSNNRFFNNFFINNTKNFGITSPVVKGTNYFDNGSIGNYWDDYLVKCPTATEIDNSGTGNIPYNVYRDGTDNHPILYKPDISKLIPTLYLTWAPDISIGSSS